MAEVKGPYPQNTTESVDTGKTDTKVVGDSNQQLNEGREKGADMSRERGTNLSDKPLPQPGK